MGRKQYRSDLASTRTVPPSYITDVRPTENDGEVAFIYTNTDGNARSIIEGRLLLLNVDDYPSENEYLIFTNDENVPFSVQTAFENLPTTIRAQTLQVALQEIAAGLLHAMTSGNALNPISLSGDVDEDDSEPLMSADENVDMEDDADWDDEVNGSDDEVFNFASQATKKARLSTSAAAPEGAETRKEQAVADLRATKKAGYKVGIYGDFASTTFITIGIRVAKLGISEEAMQAWGIGTSQYLVLVLRFSRGYKSLDTVRELSELSGPVEARVGICSSYKPSESSVKDTFVDTENGVIASQKRESSDDSATDLKPLFIGRPLHDLLRTRFPMIVEFRHSCRLSWTGAEQLYREVQGKVFDAEDIAKYSSMTDATSRTFPDIVLQDQMSQNGLKTGSCSLPLVAMQFVLRHFVQCTDFCLVCHCKLSDAFEALRPYVCSDSLCLYQYLSLGFGTSIEWEIIKQPWVVDLLISFCYTQAQAGKLRDFPDGIALKVPSLPTKFTRVQWIPAPYPARSHNKRSDPHPTPLLAPCPPIKVHYNYHERTLSLSPTDYKKAKLRTGDFIALSGTKLPHDLLYHRVANAKNAIINLDKAIEVDRVAEQVPSTLAKPSSKTEGVAVEVDLHLFDQDFDQLSSNGKSDAILSLLDTVPPVKEMVDYLNANDSHGDVKLIAWKDRISESALNVLRWIIASNRSCIMQVDNVFTSDADKQNPALEGRVGGMSDYMQFRFAQGAPDKEQRFVNAIRENCNTAYPTIFAWHGSPLYNWHSIIREGLNWDQIANGRAYGDGVYMSPHATTSIGYGTREAKSWPNSALKMSAVLSVNEVVNRPDQFVSRHPHYVVKQTDWIQTRYLLVRTKILHSTTCTETEHVEQDPSCMLYDARHAPATIPITAIPRSRRPHAQVQIRNSKKRKNSTPGRGTAFDPIEIDDDLISVATMDEDRRFLEKSYHDARAGSLTESDDGIEIIDDAMPFEKKTRSDSATCSDSTTSLTNGCLVDFSKTDFRPGTLCTSDIKELPAPDEPSLTASNNLLKAFRSLLKTQSTNPASQLGWYINPDGMENIYQWIVELHSFDTAIPLSTDMKRAGITSIVLEMRFTNDYPFAPPFVRVIKPRFLPFAAGGGGHVLDGGAICMELLTDSGWTVVSTIESVLLQIRLAMSEEERPARLAGASYGRHAYGVGEAIAAYERACLAHGWKVPAAFKNLQRD